MDEPARRDANQVAGCSVKPRAPSGQLQLFLLVCDAVHYANWNCKPLNICFEGFATIFDDSAGHTPAEPHSPPDVIAEDDFPGFVVVIEARDLGPVGRNAASNDSFRCQAENFYLVSLRDRYGVYPAVRCYRWESLSVAEVTKFHGGAPHA